VLLKEQEINLKINLEIGPNITSSEEVAAIERIEMEAWIDCYAAAPASFARDFGLSVQRANGFALFAIQKSPMTLFNRSLSIGVTRPMDEATLESATVWLRNHCGSTWAVPLATGAQPPELPDWLLRNGLTPAKAGIAKFRRIATDLVAPVECPYDIRLVSAEMAGDFGVTAMQGLGLEEGFDRWLAALCGREHWQTFAAYDGSAPVGVGAMYVKDGFAWLGMGATLPAFRGKGVQSAMLARRISEAVTLDSTFLTVDTYHAGIGEPPNISYRNVIRAGFSFGYFRPQYTAQ
jgi:hypothetical protein